MLDLTGITLPFAASDLVTAAMSLLGVVAAIVLLGLAFRVAPKFITLIFSAIRGSK